MKYTYPLDPDNFSITSYLEISHNAGTNWGKLTKMLKGNTAGYPDYIPQRYGRVSKEFVIDSWYSPGTAHVYMGKFTSLPSADEWANISRRSNRWRRNLIVIPSRGSVDLKKIYGEAEFGSNDDEVSFNYNLRDSWGYLPGKYQLGYNIRNSLFTDVGGFHSVHGSLAMVVVGMEPTLEGILELEYRMQYTDVMVSVDPPLEAVAQSRSDVVDYKHHSKKHSGLVSEIRKMVSPKIHIFPANKDFGYVDSSGNYLIGLSRTKKNYTPFRVDNYRLRHGVPITANTGYPYLKAVSLEEIEENGTYKDPEVKRQVGYYLEHRAHAEFASSFWQGSSHSRHPDNS